MLNVALLGSGRMAHVYGPKIEEHHGLQLACIYNPNLASAEAAVKLYGGEATDELERVLGDDSIDAVIIATPTNTHVEYIKAAAKAGKAIYCEKPVDLSLERVDQCVEVLEAHSVPFMVGFNRRFDPDNTALQVAVRAGDIGELNMLMSTSREPSPPPIGYVKSSGGYFLDAQIHDIDLLCWIAGEWPTEVFAAGSCLVDPEIGAVGDIDTAMTTLKMPSGCLCHINNSRRSVYGFDQRLEAFGSNGLLQTINHRDENLVRWTSNSTEAKSPLKHFFLERYDKSFFFALDEFYKAVSEGRSPSSNLTDGRNALAVALACDRSRRAGVAVKIAYE